MALDPATAKLIAKVVISQITDEEKKTKINYRNNNRNSGIYIYNNDTTICFNINDR